MGVPLKSPSGGQILSSADDLSLESNNSFLELSIGYQEIHSDMVVMQEQLRVVRQERDEYLQQRNNLIDQQNQSMQDCVIEKAKPATSAEQQARPSKSGYRRNHVDVPSSSEESESEELQPKKAKFNLPLKFVPSKFSTPFHSPKAELQFRMKKNKALLSNGKLYTITLCGVPDLLKTPEPQELGALALIGLGQKKDISIPDGNVCSPKPGSGGGLKQKLFIFYPLSGPNSEEFKAVGKKIFLVPFNANFDYVPPKPPTVKCNVCEELVDPMVMALHKASCGTGANGSDFYFYEEEE
ncbi:hypothetical protein OUZ56_009007 [Daphnia magna]|uniref:Uncharacterized protein n=1 Tax=Daphnia magna TaxID=35525 RepID=A0ABR0AEQ5_9CRUS|nr:hypothetical protein OUZ56_009007 [Daphnia magna]